MFVRSHSLGGQQLPAIQVAGLMAGLVIHVAGIHMCESIHHQHLTLIPSTNPCHCCYKTKFLSMVEEVLVDFS